MAVDYDLVILGGTPEGIAAADYATRFGARVALVLQGQIGRKPSLTSRGALTMLQQVQLNPETDLPLAWRNAVQRASLVADNLSRDDFRQLMVLGVDVIAEHGKLTGDRPLCVETPDRRLTARALLLATGAVPSVPAIPGLEPIATETPAVCLQRQILPRTAVILGSSPTGLALAQLISRWGVSTTLVTPGQPLLHREDPSVSQWIAAQLRAEGIRLELARIDAVADSPTGTTIQVAGSTIPADAVVVAVPPTPATSDIGLEPFLPESRPLTVNAYLQTSHPRMYACGLVLGGYDLPAIARQEAHIAVENALFWNRRRIDYQTLPYDLPTQPEMVRVGLTEPQARQRYGDEVVMSCRQPLYTNVKAHSLNSTIGFCKIIAHRDGQLLGAHGVGPDASEWVQVLAMMMAQRLPWWAIARQATLPHSLTHVLREATQQWERQLWAAGRWRYDWAENWCNWRRSR